MRALPFESVMALPEDQIRQLFPHGAVELRGRWLPAGPESENVRTLDELLKDKRKRRHKPRLLKATYSRDNYTDIPAYGMRREGEAIDKEAQEAFSQEARERDAQAAEKPLSERVAALEGVARRDQLRSLEKRIKQVERAMGEKVA